LSSASLSFARGGSDAYLLVKQNPAGGAQVAQSDLYRSADNGLTWSSVGEPCPQVDSEDDSTAVAAGAEGRVAVLCAERSASSSDRYVATSTDHGAHFTAQPGRIPRAAAAQLVGDPATVLVASWFTVARSVDGGRSWVTVPYAMHDPSFIGFESARVGRIVAADGREIWTTRDGGATWSSVQFR
jgi:photosystem II stability/assembly factor-like uncharacterized protein